MCDLKCVSTKKRKRISLPTVEKEETYEGHNRRRQMEGLLAPAGTGASIVCHSAPFEPQIVEISTGGEWKRTSPMSRMVKGREDGVGEILRENELRLRGLVQTGRLKCVELLRTFLMFCDVHRFPGCGNMKPAAIDNPCGCRGTLHDHRHSGSGSKPTLDFISR
jgi:hypothetical protein